MGTSGMSRRDFLRIGGGAGAGLFFIGQIAGVPFKIPVAAAQIPGGSLDPATVPKFQTPMLIPPVMPRAGTITMPGGKPADYYEISVRQFAAADPARRASRPRPCGATAASRGAEQPRPADPQRPVADHRGQRQPSGARQVGQRARGRQRQLPAPPAAGRPDAALGQPPGRHDGRDSGRPSRRPPARTRARCRSSPTRTAPSASATRATATPRRGTCPPPTTSRPASPPRAPGTTSSPARRRRSSA